jgi:hypothetical protein
LFESAFPREFAEFVEFVGAERLQKALTKVETKLKALSKQSRSLYGDRYYFQYEFMRLTHGPVPFRLVASDLRSVRTASVVAGINRIRRSLTPEGASHLREMLLDNLKPDRDFRQIEHEIRCWTHFRRRGFAVRLEDLSGLGNFDLLLGTPSGEFEVECKTITEHAGYPIKIDLNVRLAEAFRKTVDRIGDFPETGLFELTLKKPPEGIRRFEEQLQAALNARSHVVEKEDFQLVFQPRPDWQHILDAGHSSDAQRRVLSDESLGDDGKMVVLVGGRYIGLVIRAHRPTTLRESVVEVIKHGADQCSGTRPAMVWLHFVYMDQEFFSTLTELSRDGRGLGLNSIVAEAMHPGARSRDRTHMERVRFSAAPSSLSHRLALQPDLLVGRAVSVEGIMYDVPLPRSRFAVSIEL